MIVLKCVLQIVFAADFGGKFQPVFDLSDNVFQTLLFSVW